MVAVTQRFKSASRERRRAGCLIATLIADSIPNSRATICGFRQMRTRRPSRTMGNVSPKYAVALVAMVADQSDLAVFARGVALQAPSIGGRQVRALANVLCRPRDQPLLPTYPVGLGT